MSRKKAYVIGTNVSNSLSPAIFQYWFEKHNIDGKYGYIEIKEKDFDKEIKLILKEENLVGLNITIPYKEKIIPHLAPNDIGIMGLDIHAGRIGAVNYITKTSLIGDWHGHNSDYLGFEMSIKPFEKKTDIKTAIVIGYGGAAKAIIYSLYKKGKKIKLFNRSYKKISNLGIDMPHYNQLLGWEKKPKHMFVKVQPHSNYPIDTIKSYKLEDLEKHTHSADIIINTTPINVLNKSNKLKIKPNTIGFDVVYKPKGGTGFLNHFEPENRIEGIYMLAHQASFCWDSWFLGDSIINDDSIDLVDEDLINYLFKKMEEDT